MAKSAAYSLQSRLLVSVVILLASFLGLTGLVLDRAFRTSVEAGVSEQLRVQIYVLLAAVDEEAGEFYFSESLQEPRFSQIGSGLYGFLSSPDEGVLLKTQSALDVELPTELLNFDLERGETRFDLVDFPINGQYFLSTYSVTWENRDEPVLFTVLETQDLYLLEVNNFRRSLWSWLGGLAVLLLVLQLTVLRWGLSPLRTMSRELAAIESGSSDKLQARYPRELEPVTSNLNLLIQTERKQQQRYRTTLGDLAHSLKTPLAVMQGEINQLADVRGTQSDRESTAHESSRQTLQEQLDRMNQLVSYQLQRAVKSEAAPSLSRHVPVAKVVAGICRALEKVYRDKPVTISQHIDSALLFQGDERDLMEVMGNVLDNACKYGNGQVSISSVTVSALPDVVKNAADLPAVMDSRSDQLLLLIEDNGDGVDHALQQQVLERGVRLDTLKQGQGIGLAVVNDIVTSYGGLLAIAKSARLGGAAVMIGLENFRLKPSGSTS